MNFDRTIQALLDHDHGLPGRSKPGLAWYVRKAYWLDTGGDPAARDACLAMTVEQVRHAVDKAAAAAE
jgi:hypothetical protein